MRPSSGWNGWLGLGSPRTGPIASPVGFQRSSQLRPAECSQRQPTPPCREPPRLGNYAGPQFESDRAPIVGRRVGMTGIINEIIANIVVAILTIIIAFLFFFFVYSRERGQILRFFGFQENRSDLVVYVSRLRVQAGGAHGIVPISTGYVGPAITKIEYDGALRVCGSLRSRYIPLIPRNVQDWFNRRFFSLLSLNPDIRISPPEYHGGDVPNVVAIGSPVYNAVTSHYMSGTSSWFVLNNRQVSGGNERIFQVKRGGLAGHDIPGRSAGKEIGTLQRIVAEENNVRRTVFICAGTGTSATFGSVRYLMDHWQELHKKYGREDFAVWLEFRGQSPEPPDDEHVNHPTNIVYVPA